RRPADACAVRRLVVALDHRSVEADRQRLSGCRFRCVRAAICTSMRRSPMNRHGQLIRCLALGFVASCVVAVGEPPIDAQAEPGAAHAITHLLDDRHHVATGGAGVIGLVAMVLAWAWLIRLARENSLRLRWPVAAAVAWTLPVVIGGPVLSSDVYAYGA